MSGGTFEYMQYRIDDAVEEIERRLSINNKTIQQRWDEATEEERGRMCEYDTPWTLRNHPYWIDREAEDAADESIGINRYDDAHFELPQDKKDKWNETRLSSLQKFISEHNASCAGANYSDKTVELMREMLVTIKKAAIYLNRIDWLMAGDDGEASFQSRTKEDLERAGLK